MLLCIRYQFTDIILCIIATFCLRIVFLTILAITVPPVLPYRLRTPSSKLCQPRILLDFDAPAGRIRQMQVQAVDLVIGKDVHLFLHEFLVEEMTGNVQHHSPVRETRLVLDGEGRKLGAVLPFQLQQRLYAVKESGTGKRRDFHLLRSHRQPIAFRRGHPLDGRNHLQHHLLFAGLLPGCLQFQAGCLQIIRQNLLIRLRSVYPQGSIVLPYEFTLLHHQFRRNRSQFRTGICNNSCCCVQ